jgi:hypothetical protein
MRTYVIIAAIKIRNTKVVDRFDPSVWYENMMPAEMSEYTVPAAKAPNGVRDGRYVSDRYLGQ